MSSFVLFPPAVVSVKLQSCSTMRLAAGLLDHMTSHLVELSIVFIALWMDAITRMGKGDCGKLGEVIDCQH